MALKAANQIDGEKGINLRLGFLDDEMSEPRKCHTGGAALVDDRHVTRTRRAKPSLRGRGRPALGGEAAQQRRGAANYANGAKLPEPLHKD